MHAIDLANKVDYAVGSVTNSGWEKIVEMNPMHTDYVILSLSGYNGKEIAHFLCDKFHIHNSSLFIRRMLQVHTITPKGKSTAAIWNTPSPMARITPTPRTSAPLAFMSG